ATGCLPWYRPGFAVDQPAERWLPRRRTSTSGHLHSDGARCWLPPGTPRNTPCEDLQERRSPGSTRTEHAPQPPKSGGCFGKGDNSASVLRQAIVIDLALPLARHERPGVSSPDDSSSNFAPQGRGSPRLRLVCRRLIRGQNRVP